MTNKIIVRQRNKICSLEKRLKVSRKWIKMLLGGLCLVFVINIIMLSILLKISYRMCFFWDYD